MEEAADDAVEEAVESGSKVTCHLCSGAMAVHGRRRQLPLAVVAAVDTTTSGERSAAAWGEGNRGG